MRTLRENLELVQYDGEVLEEMFLRSAAGKLAAKQKKLNKQSNNYEKAKKRELDNHNIERKISLGDDIDNIKDVYNVGRHSREFVKKETKFKKALDNYNKEVNNQASKGATHIRKNLMKNGEYVNNDVRNRHMELEADKKMEKDAALDAIIHKAGTFHKNSQHRERQKAVGTIEKGREIRKEKQKLSEQIDKIKLKENNNRGE